LKIENNNIGHITASTADFGSGGRGAYGIQLSIRGASGGVINRSLVSGNEIHDLSGHWSHAIGLEGNTPGATV
jgi:hypothetical protein